VVCVCVREREQERERACERVCIFLCVSVCFYVFVYKNSLKRCPHGPGFTLLVCGGVGVRVVSWLGGWVSGLVGGWGGVWMAS